jgi:hypothetical protein
MAEWARNRTSAAQDPSARAQQPLVHQQPGIDEPVIQGLEKSSLDDPRCGAQLSLDIAADCEQPVRLFQRFARPGRVHRDQGGSVPVRQPGICLSQSRRQGVDPVAQRLPASLRQKRLRAGADDADHAVPVLDGAIGLHGISRQALCFQ